MPQQSGFSEGTQRQMFSGQQEETKGVSKDAEETEHNQRVEVGENIVLGYN